MRDDPDDLLRQADRADADDLAREERLGRHARHDDLGDTRRLLFEHAAQHRLAVENHRRVEQERDRDGEWRVRPSRGVAAASLLGESLALEHETRSSERVDERRAEVGVLESLRERRLAQCRLESSHVADGGRLASSVACALAAQRARVEHDVPVDLLGHDGPGRQALGGRDPVGRRDAHVDLVRRVRRRRRIERRAQPVAEPRAGRVDDDQTRRLSAEVAQRQPRRHEQHARDEHGAEQAADDEPSSLHALEILAADDRPQLSPDHSFPPRRLPRRPFGGRSDAATAAPARSV